MNVLDSLNSSSMSGGIPRQGTFTAPVSSEEDIAALLAQISDGSEEIEEAVINDDLDAIQDLDRLTEELPASLGGPTQTAVRPQLPTRQRSTSITSDVVDDSVDTDLAEEETDETAENNVESKPAIKKYVLAAVAIIAVIVLVVIIVNANKSEPTEQPIDSNSTGYTQNTFYADQLTLTDSQTYQDSMTIEKYIVLEEDACLFVFKGYAETARAFVTAYVDAETYNRYKTGARVPILYERITINSKDYYMKVRVLYEN